MEKDINEIIILSMKVDDLLQIPTEDRIGYFWLDKDGKYTRNKEELVSKEEIRVPQNRYAESEKDYESILVREASIKNQSVNDYAEILLEDLIVMIDRNVNEFRTLNVDLTDKRIRAKKFIKFLENRKRIDNAINYNVRIFNSEYGYNIYKRWEDLCKGSKTELADFSFIYWFMKEKDLINIGVRKIEFLNWLEDERDIFFSGSYELKSKIKSINNKQIGKISIIIESMK